MGSISKLDIPYLDAMGMAELFDGILFGQWRLVS